MGCREHSKKKKTKQINTIIIITVNHVRRTFDYFVGVLALVFRVVAVQITFRSGRRRRHTAAAHAVWSELRIWIGGRRGCVARLH